MKSMLLFFPPALLNLYEFVNTGRMGTHSTKKILFSCSALTEVMPFEVTTEEIETSRNREKESDRKRENKRERERESTFISLASVHLCGTGEADESHSSD